MGMEKQIKVQRMEDLVILIPTPRPFVSYRSLSHPTSSSHKTKAPGHLRGRKMRPWHGEEIVPTPPSAPPLPLPVNSSVGLGRTCHGWALGTKAFFGLPQGSPRVTLPWALACHLSFFPTQKSPFTPFRLSFSPRAQLFRLVPPRQLLNTVPNTTSSVLCPLCIPPPGLPGKPDARLRVVPNITLRAEVRESALRLRVAKANSRTRLGSISHFECPQSTDLTAWAFRAHGTRDARVHCPVSPSWPWAPSAGLPSAVGWSSFVQPAALCLGSSRIPDSSLIATRIRVVPGNYISDPVRVPASLGAVFILNINKKLIASAQMAGSQNRIFLGAGPVGKMEERTLNFLLSSEKLQ